MYINYTKTLLVSSILSLGLMLSFSALAGPGKPGQNDIAPGGNIVEVAVAANSILGVFDTVLAAATCPYFGNAVVDILAGDDKVTLFAPTDDAFAALGLDETTICDAFAADPNALLGILAYHVTEGRRFSNSVFNSNNSKEIDMLMGGYIVSTPDLTLFDNAGQEVGVVLPFVNINASNGVIHVIDTVLLP